MHAFLNGAVLGFLIAAPVGPIGLLCISRTLRAGWLVGVASGLGAAAADGVYASLAAFGITAAIRSVQSVAMPVHVAGAILLFLMGVRDLQSKGAVATESGTAPPPYGAFAGTFGLTLLNPATIVSFVAIFAAASGRAPASPEAAAAIVAGVFTGSAVWWLILASVIASVRRVAGRAILRRINIASGLTLIAFAAYALFTRAE